MIYRTFSQNPLTRGKSHHHYLKLRKQDCFSRHCRECILYLLFHIPYSPNREIFYGTFGSLFFLRKASCNRVGLPILSNHLKSAEFPKPPDKVYLLQGSLQVTICHSWAPNWRSNPQLASLPHWNTWPPHLPVNFQRKSLPARRSCQRTINQVRNSICCKKQNVYMESIGSVSSSHFR